MKQFFCSLQSFLIPLKVVFALICQQLHPAHLWVDGAHALHGTPTTQRLWLINA
jgi:hypothetical protein